MEMFAITLYLVTYLCTLINGDAVDIPTGRIFHGKKVTSCKKYPWHALLNYDRFTCGGTLISEKYVLTASHCSDECKVGSHYDIYLGSTKHSSGTKHKGTLKACLDNSINFDWDVALLELSTSVTRTECIDFLSIFDVEGSINEDLPVTAIGFGITESGDYPENLYETTSLRTWNLDICEKKLGQPYGAFTAHICTRSNVVKGQNVCTGDSGGGLFYKKDGYEPVLLGITSFGSDNCSAGFAAYAKVNDPKIYHWIINMTKNDVIDFIINGTEF